MKKLRFLFLLGLLFAAQAIYAQLRVSGRVTGENNAPLSGATVNVKTTNANVFTDADGNFTITAPANSTLVVSYSGYQSVERNIGSSNVTGLLIELRPSNASLSEVVVTGYTTQTRRQFTGSVAKVSGQEVRLQPIASFEQLLQGKTTGVLIQSQSGQPGLAAAVTIRGRGSVLGGTDPLYIVDGVQITASDFQGINPADIETYNILKDAVATAQYGSRGANGVIVITTRRGQNAKTRFNYDFQYGVQSLPKNKLDLLTSAEHIDYELNYDRPFYGVNPFGWSQAESDSLSKVNVDWEDVIFRKAKTQQHILSATGGNDRTRFFLSGSVFKQEGLVRTTSLDRYTGRANLDHTTGNLKIGLTTSVGYSTFTGTDENDNIVTTPLNAFRWIMPYVTPYGPDGDFNRDDPGGNPNPLVDLYLTTNKNKQIKALGSISLDYKIPFARGLSVRTLWGVDFTDNQNENYIDENSYSNSVVQGSSGAFATTSLRRTRFTGTTSLNYEKRSGDHNFGAGVFLESIKRRTNSFGFTGYGLTGPLKNAAGITQGNSSNTFSANVAGNQNEEAIISYFFIGNYDYKGKYFLNLTGRRDGSSRLAPGYKFVNYGGVGIGWLVTEEFMKGQGVFNNLRLKASYGSSGNSSIGDSYEAIEQFGPVSYNGVGGLRLINIKKPGLTWETRQTLNVGTEFSLLNSRLTGVIEAYSANTNGLYLNRQLSSTNGVGSIVTNMGKLSNRGLEISLDYAIIKNNNFSWNVNVNWTGNKSKIVELDGNEQNIQGISINKIGQPLNSVYIVRYAGVNAENGEAQYLTKDGKKTETYSPDDAVIIGQFDPKGFGGFGTNLSFRGIELSVLFNYQYGHKVYNNARADLENPEYWYSGLSRSLLREWKQTGDVTDIPSSFSDFQYSTSRFIESGDFLRLRNVMLSYSLPKSLTDRMHLSGIRFFVQGQNLYTWHKFLGYDPEVATGALTGAQYPALKAFTAGISVGF